MIAANIAQPNDTMVKPDWVKPSMLNVSGATIWLIQATSSSKAPLITNEIKPKVSM